MENSIIYYNIDNFVNTIKNKFYERIKFKDLKYINIPAAFDIETTSFEDELGEAAIMYAWGFGIDKYIVIGRTWEEYIELLDKLTKVLKLDNKTRLVVYIHNLNFEYSFMKYRFKWKDYFFLDRTTPLMIVDNHNIEYRCSRQLTGMNLETLGYNIGMPKKVGDLDYTLIRHSKTPMSKKEYKYLITDVDILLHYISKQIEIDENIGKIKLTKTGYIRRLCRERCIYSDNRFSNNKYRNKIKELTLDTNEYFVLRKAYQGGFTQINEKYVGAKIENVKSFDLTSSYPTVMMTEKFPMGKGVKVKITKQKQLENYLKNYCCAFMIKINNIKSKTDNVYYIPESKCTEITNEKVYKGKVVSAKSLTMGCTEVDLKIIKQCYDYESLQFATFYIYEKNYLPTQLVNVIVELYAKKQALKNTEYKTEYILNKELLNAIYGMMVTNLVRDKITLDNGNTQIVKPVIDKAINDYNNNGGRFLFYAWGIWVSAYARRNLFTGILEAGDDFVYCDTDSIKIKNYNKHKEYFNIYKQMIHGKLKKACYYHDIGIDLLDKLGEWDVDGDYKQFKALGPKKYISLNVDNSYDITIAGLGKQGREYLIEKYKDKLLDNFNYDMSIDAENSGKPQHTYLNYIIEGEVTDYTGIKHKFKEYSGTHLKNVSFSFDDVIELQNFIYNTQNRRY